MGVEQFGDVVLLEGVQQSIDSERHLRFDLIGKEWEDGKQPDLSTVVSSNRAELVREANGRREHHGAEVRVRSERLGRVAARHRVPRSQPGVVLMRQPGQNLELADWPIVALVLPVVLIEGPDGWEQDHQLGEVRHFTAELVGDAHRAIAHPRGHQGVEGAIRGGRHHVNVHVDEVRDDLVLHGFDGADEPFHVPVDGAAALGQTAATVPLDRRPLGPFELATFPGPNA